MNKIEYLNKMEKKKIWDVGCVVKWYSIIDKVIFWMVKQDEIAFLDTNALLDMTKFPCFFFFFCSKLQVFNRGPLFTIQFGLVLLYIMFHSRVFTFFFFSFFLFLSLFIYLFPSINDKLSFIMKVFCKNIMNIIFLKHKSYIY